MSEAPTLTDGIIELSAFTLDDVEPHVDAEDGESVTWLTEGRPSTIATTRDWAAQHLRSWEAGGPRRMLAIRVAGTGTLAGMIEANLDSDSCGLPAGEVNISFMVQAWARGRGFATRAVELLCDWLEGIEGAEVAVLRIDPDNTASLGVAARARFEDAGRITTPDGDHCRYFRRVLRRDRRSSMSPAPITSTDRLSIRPLTPADAAALGEADLVFVDADCAAWVASQMRHQQEHGFSFWLLVTRASLRPVGYCGFMDRGSDGVSLGYEVVPEARGAGLATEAARAVLDWADVHGLESVFASVRPPNPASTRVLEKVGMRLDEVCHDEYGERHIYRRRAREAP